MLVRSGPGKQNGGGGGGGDMDLRQKARTPVRGERLEAWLAAYWDKKAAGLLKNGFHEGFHLGYKGPTVRRWADNLKSAKAQQEVVQTKLDKEVKEGRMAGPFSNCPMPNLIVSPIGIVSK